MKVTKEIEEPKVKVDSDSTISTHPAFGQITAARWSGGKNILYGSGLRHDNSIAITISTSELVRNLHRDWYHAKKELIEVVMSESQWATFITAMNCGDGVPCTIRYVDGKRMPDLPEPKMEKDVYVDELHASLKEVVDTLDNISKMIDGLPLSKVKKDAVLELTRKCTAKLTSSVTFAVDSFKEHTNETVSKAKQEIYGFFINTINRLGIESATQPVTLGVDDAKPPEQEDANVQ